MGGLSNYLVIASTPQGPNLTYLSGVMLNQHHRHVASWLKLATAAGNDTETDLKKADFGSLVDFCAGLGEIGKISARLGEKFVKAQLQ